jgi:hypothetical protein
VYKNSWFDGYFYAYGSGNNEGSYANVAARYGAVCDTDTNPSHNFVEAWAMVAGRDTQGYVQTGYTRGYNQCTVLFGQVRQNDTFTPQSKYGTSCIATDGTTYGFGERYGPTCGCEYAKINGNVWMTTSWNPYSYWATPFAPEFFGEATYRESDMPGNAANPTSFTGLQGQDASTDNFYNIGCNVLTKQNDWLANRGDGESWYDRITSCPSFNIYTDVAGH